MTYLPPPSSNLSRTSALEGVGGQPHAPAVSTPGKTRYPLYRSLGGPQGRSGRAENLVPTGSRSRTVQPVVIAIPTELTGPLQFHMDMLRMSATDSAVSAGGVTVGRVKPKEMSTFAFNLIHRVFPRAVYWSKMRCLSDQR